MIQEDSCIWPASRLNIEHIYADISIPFIKLNQSWKLF